MRRKVLGASLLGMTITLSLAGTANAADTLGAAAALTGRSFGAAVTAFRLGEPAYATTLDREFTSVTPENEMKWNATEPSPGHFTFGSADQIVDHAQSRGMKIRGHTLVWHSQLPGWVQNLTSANDVRAAMNGHITNVMGHFRGEIYAWDVVNEAFADSGPAGTLRPTVFQQRLGNGFIEEAFRTARAADPNAKLCYNDYNIDDANATKTQGVYAMVRDFKARGVPIDCVGLQSHFGYVPGNYQQNIAQFAALGVDVQITELDVGGSGSAQADAYRRVTQACMAVPRCTGITVWGVTDKYSWRSGDTPLLFDGNYNKKPAYFAVLEALGGVPQQQAAGSIVGVQSGRCVDVPGATTANGAQVQLWGCHGGANQRWTHTAAKQLLVYGNKCLDTYNQGTSAGTAVVIWDCNGQANQQWNLNANGTITGARSGLCLDANGAGTANGTKIILWRCNGQANQQWTFLS